MNSVNIHHGDKVVIFSKKFSGKLKKNAANNCIFLKSSKRVLFTVAESFKNTDEKTSFNISGTPKKTLKNFSKHFKVIEAAGGLILNNKKEILFIYRNKKWDLPKGKIEAGEKVKKAAVRECEEECGINGIGIEKKLPPTYHIYQMKGEWILKKTHWFLMKSNFTGKLIPQKEEGISKVEWLNTKNQTKVLKNTFPSIYEVLNAYSEKI